MGSGMVAHVAIVGDIEGDDIGNNRGDIEEIDRGDIGWMVGTTHTRRDKTTTIENTTRAKTMAKTMEQW